MNPDFSTSAIGWQPSQSGLQSSFLERQWDRAERRIEILRPATADRGAWQRIERWRLGTAPKMLWFRWLVMLAVLAPVTLGSAYLLGCAGDSPFSWRLQVGMLAIFLSMIGAAFTLHVWLARMASLPAELLRPSVGNPRRDLALALAWDLAPSVLLFAVGEAAAMNLFDGQNRFPWVGLLASFVVFLSLAIAATSAAVWTLLARRRWLGVCLLALAGVAAFVGVTYTAITGPKDATDLWHGVLWQLWVPTVLAAMMGWLALRRWNTMELAELES